jgi:hypothetical protein
VVVALEAISKMAARQMMHMTHSDVRGEPPENGGKSIV